MKLSEAYDKMVANENIPKEVTSAVFTIMNNRKLSEEEKQEKVRHLMNAMQASCNYLISLLDN